MLWTFWLWIQVHYAEKSQWWKFCLHKQIQWKGFKVIEENFKNSLLTLRFNFIKIQSSWPAGKKCRYRIISTSLTLNLPSFLLNCSDFYLIVKNYVCFFELWSRSISFQLFKNRQYFLSKVHLPMQQSFVKSLNL